MAFWTNYNDWVLIRNIFYLLTYLLTYSKKERPICFASKFGKIN